MKLTFENSRGEQTILIKNADSVDEIWKEIKSFLKKKRKRASYYRIVGVTPRKTMIDFGSWTEFFYINVSSVKFIALDEKRRQNTTVSKQEADNKKSLE